MSLPLSPTRDEPEEQVIAPALGRAVGRGTMWMIVGTIGSKGFSLVAQILLGLWLAKDEWGIFSVSMSVAFFLQVFRDGGVRHLLVQRGAEEYPTLSGPIFWMAMTFNLVTALVMIATAPLLARWYGDPRLTGLLIVMAVTVPIGTVALVAMAKLRIDLRFGTLARMHMMSALIRHGGAVLLARLGFGPMAFVLPLLGVAAFDSTYSYLKTRDKPWLRKAKVHTWPHLFGQSKWLVLLAVAMVGVDMGDYAVLGLLLDPALVGLYYFAYQLIAQTGALLAVNVEGVLLPALSKLKEEEERRRQALVRSLHALSLVSAPASLILAAVSAPLELLLWGGKWASAVPAMQVLGVFYPARAIFVVASAYLLASGRFRQVAMLFLVLGAGRMAAAAAVGSVTDEPTTIAWVIGLYVFVSCIGGLIWAMRSAGIPAVQVLKAIGPSWLIAGVAAAAAVGLDYILQGSPPAVRLMAAGAAGGLVFLGLARSFVPEHLRDAINAAPARLGEHAMRLLRL